MILCAWRSKMGRGVGAWLLIVRLTAFARMVTF